MSRELKVDVAAPIAAHRRGRLLILQGLGAIGTDILRYDFTGSKSGSKCRLRNPG